ncbi:MAG: hypothetical protein LBT48_05160 [Prevotellaceae bacterium]|jgi:hypothetical protein|nr:hypothetical protein [Prevotellaceae bacterium]
MKIKFLYIFVVIVAGLFSACENEDVDSVMSLAVAGQEFAIQAVGSTETLPLVSNQPWTATVTSLEGDVSWLQLSQTSGAADAVVSVIIDTNRTANERSAMVTFQGAGKTKSVSYKQVGTKLTVGKVSTFSCYGDSSTLSVSSLVPWTYTQSANSDWLSVVREGDSLLLSVGSYTVSADRSATLTFKATGLSDVRLKVTQGKAKINAASSVELGITGGSYSVPVDCISDWALVPRAYPAWITSLARRTGVGAGITHADTIDIAFQANPYYMERKDTIKLTAGELGSLNVPMKQPAREALHLALYPLPNDPIIKDTMTVMMIQGTSTARKKQFTYTSEFPAGTKLTVSLISRGTDNGPMFGADAAGVNINATTTNLDFVFVPEAVIGSNINQWTITEKATYTITVELKDALDAVSYIKFEKK